MYGRVEHKQQSIAEIVSRHTACIPTAIQLIHHGPELWTDWLTPRTDAQAALSVLEGRGAQNKRITLSSQRDEPRRAAQASGVDGLLRLVDHRPVAALTIIGCPTVNAGCPTTTRKASWRPYLLPIPFQRAPCGLLRTQYCGLVLRQVPVGVHADSQCGHSWHDN